MGEVVFIYVGRADGLDVFSGGVVKVEQGDAGRRSGLFSRLGDVSQVAVYLAAGKGAPCK